MKIPFENLVGNPEKSLAVLDEYRKNGATNLYCIYYLDVQQLNLKYPVAHNSDTVKVTDFYIVTKIDDARMIAEEGILRNQGVVSMVRVPKEQEDGTYEYQGLVTDVLQV